MKIEKIFQQSGVVPFRKNGDDKFEILIIRSRKDKRWIIPKGIIDNGYSAQEAARKEAVEEAGIDGKIINVILGAQVYKKWGGKCKVVYYPLKVTEVHKKWEEDFRKRKWINIDLIQEFIKEKQLLIIIRNLKEIITA
ncbi:MAG: NUDIX hydrolase [Melioribacteraceae bacterium]|nr:NUDIX hydrolase [Melioribacteraceae bacterium]MCF8264503.1 NUDIX hydrolase [Melioribacteraceae bacterium]MCF8432031.1 NUDIX hydrolase [Melioribacteraceae bacterium]